MLYHAREDVPYELEDALRAEGSSTSSTANWQPKVVVDGRLMTARIQPPQARWRRGTVGGAQNPHLEGRRALDPVLCAPEASVIKVEGLVGYHVALTREAARPQSDARLEEMMRKKACGKPPTIVPCISQIETWPLVFCRRIRSRQRRFQSRASSALDCRGDGEWPFHVAVCCAAT